jgi:HAMP domain-containing protein
LRIGTQNILSIVPLFILLAVILGGLLYVVERHERLWGQEQQASGYAIAIAEFAAERASQPGEAANYSPDTDPNLKRALDRILGNGRVKNVFELSPDSETIKWSYPKGSITSVPPDLPSDLTTTMESDGSWISDLMPTGPRTALMRACSSMLAPNKKLIGTIGVTTDASAYLRDSQQTFTWVAIAAIAVIFVGLLITMLVSGLISREVNRLSETAALISGGNLDVQAPAGHIQEIDDLGNTFNTMSEVLKDVVSRTKRSLNEGEQFRTHAETAGAYADIFRPPLAVDIGGLRVAALAHGRDFGTFWTAFETDGGCCLALGHVTAEDEMSTVIAASAATRFLNHKLTKSNARQAIEEIVDLFHPDFFECLCFGGGSVDHWTVETSALVATAASGNTENSPSAGRPAVQSYPASSRERWVLHRFTPDASSIIDRYVRVFGHHSPDDLAHDIAAALPDESEGALIIAGQLPVGG